MAICPVCNQPINESVIKGRKLVTQVYTGPHTGPGTGRYLTVLSRKCACGEWIERRYENRPACELKSV
jgi:hypothetical protein